MDSIFERIKAWLTPNEAQASIMPSPRPGAGMPPAVMLREQPPQLPLPKAAFRYIHLPSAAAMTPGEEQEDLARDRSPANRAELEATIRREKRPAVLQLLRNEHRQLFGRRQ